jgi:hypothetical protein
MAWARSLLAVATTLASSTTTPGHQEGACASKAGLRAACASPDAYLDLRQVLAPLLVAFAVMLWAHLPSLLLASRRRSHRLSLAAGHAVALWAAMIAVYAVYERISPSPAYALSLHLTVTFLSRRKSDSLLLLPPAAYAASRWLAVGALVAGAALGPPLPVVDSPGVSGYCGAVSHLAAWAAAETVGAGCLFLTLDLRAEQ